MMVKNTLFYCLGIMLIGLHTPASAAHPPGEFNVVDFGATADGKTLNTQSIQSAVDACSKAGGGRVLVPAGQFLVGCIELKSNVNFHLSAGAVLLGSTRQEDYKTKTPTYVSRTNDLYVNKSIIYAEKANNVSLTGQGIIHGQGRSKSFARVRPQTGRPYIARFIECRNVTIRDVSMLEAANWTCHVLGCKEVLIDGLKIRNHARANRDGLDIDSCDKVTITNCRIDSQDDALVFKSTGVDKTQNVTVSNCILSSHAAAIKMGTESTGGFENIAISNCVLKDVNVGGISLMTVDGGVMNNIVITNIIMQRVKVPFMIRLGNRARPHTTGVPTPGIGEVRGIKISNIVATEVSLPSHFTGLHSKSIEDISLSNVSIYYKQGFKGQSQAYNKVPFRESSYPGAKLYGTNLPASVLYCRNVNGLKIENIKAFFNDSETRIPFVFDGVYGLNVSNCEVVENNDSKALFYLRNTSRALVVGCSNAGKTDYLAFQEKENCGSVSIAPDPLAVKQKPLTTVKALPDKTYEDVKGVTHFFKGGLTDKGITYHALTQAPAKLSLKAEKGRHVKLLILSSNKGAPQWVKVTMNGKSQRVEISGSSWHWTIVNYQKPVSGNAEQQITIEAENPKSSSVRLGKVVLIPVAVTD